MEDLNCVTGLSRTALTQSLDASMENQVPFTGKDMLSLQSRVDGLLSLGMHFAGISSGEWEVKPKLFNTVKKMVTFIVMESDANRDREEISTELEESQTRMVCELCAWLEMCSRSG